VLSNNSGRSSSRFICCMTRFSNDVNFRAAEKAAAAQSEDEGMSEDEPAPTSDVELPDISDSEEKPKPKPKKKGKGKGRGKGGMLIPEEWPWEDAKKIFMEPDVLPADQVEVRSNLRYTLFSDLLCPPQLEWKNPDVDGLVQFLVAEKGFK
jgi:flap endonuclease-1